MDFESFLQSLKKRKWKCARACMRARVCVCVCVCVWSSLNVEPKAIEIRNLESSYKYSQIFSFPPTLKLTYVWIKKNLKIIFYPNGTNDFN